MTPLLDRLIEALADRLSRHFEPRINAVREAAGEAVEDLDDRVQLFRIEMRAETARLVRLAIFGVAGVICAIGSLLWICAGAILLAWPTEYRIHVIVGVVAIWIIGTAFSIGMARSLARRGRHAFQLSRSLLAADAAVARRILRERGR